MIQVQAPSRLHFGFLCLPSPEDEGRPARRFGGAGLMVQRPGLSLSVSPAAEWSASGPLAERALTFANRFVSTLASGSLPPYHLWIHQAAPEHNGLGTGTQLGLAVARALAAAAGEPEMDVRELGRRVGRGRRSALGIHGFARGGFLVEAGKSQADRIAPLVARLDFPEDWRVVLVVPGQTQGVHGTQEIQAFAQLSHRTFPPALTDALCRLVLLGMLPALAERDLPSFGEGVFEFNSRVGELFASFQGGPYADTRTAEVVAFLRRQKIQGVGQSSWGPAVFALVEDEDRARGTIELLQKKFGLSSLEMFATPACNRGGRVQETPAESPAGCLSVAYTIPNGGRVDTSPERQRRDVPSTAKIGTGDRMTASLDHTYRPLLEAVAFAARAHKGQLRKDGQTPYASHVFRVCFILRDLFGVTDRPALMAAVLHDTVEDTTTDYDDLKDHFGEEVADWVATLSKDKRRAWDEREAVYEKQLAHAPWQVQVCKLADIFDNVMDLEHMPLEKRSRGLKNAFRYLDALKRNLQEQAREPWQLVANLLQEKQARYTEAEQSLHPE